jgi:DNA-binding NarL/FixJ family response regulator
MVGAASATTPVRVLIVDDQPPFRNAAHALVDATSGFECVGGASSGEEAIEQAERLRPNLVLMDIRMPGMGGVRAAREMASRGIPAIVVLVTAEEPPTTGAPLGSVAEVISKRRLSRALLARLWQDHGSGLIPFG